MDTQMLDKVLEQLCQQGCRNVSLILQQLQVNQKPSELLAYSADECAYVYQELADIMAVYGNNSCNV